jgi:thymidylate synthase ThyX
MPPEKCAYALARYSRSPDSIRQSLEWVRTHSAQSFLKSYYFEYGHASIADLGHVAVSFENISELAAIEVEDEQLWDGQAKSSRYQDFSRTGFVTPPELAADAAHQYQRAGQAMLDAYQELHALAFDYLSQQLPRPESMKEEAYRRNIAARAFDVARYLLFLGVPTNVGQVTSIRTLQKQIGRLKASEFAELRELAEELAEACASKPDCVWDQAAQAEPVAPTLAQFAQFDAYLVERRRNLRLWAEQNLPGSANQAVDRVDLLRPADATADVVATLLYPVTSRPFRELYEIAVGWSQAVRREVLDVGLRSRADRDDIPRAFRNAPYSFDMVIDVGAYRDLHRHRRCQQFRQDYSGRLGYDTPELVSRCGATSLYEQAMTAALAASSELGGLGGQYLLPFGARSRFLFKMDFAEAEYISRVRSGVKGHFSYRDIAWQMKRKMEQLEPELGRLIAATPPWTEDPLKR